MLPKFASCFATPGIGHLRVTLGHFNDSEGHFWVTLGHYKITKGQPFCFLYSCFFLLANIRQTLLSFTPK